MALNLNNKIQHLYIGKSVIGSNIHIEVNELFTHFGSCFLKLSQRFGFSTRSLGHMTKTSS